MPVNPPQKILFFVLFLDWISFSQFNATLLYKAFLSTTSSDSNANKKKFILQCPLIFSYASHWFSVGSFFRFQFIQAATRERETEKKLKRQLPYFVKCLVHKRIFIENKRIKFNEGIGTSFNWHSPQQLFTRKSHEKHE